MSVSLSLSLGLSHPEIHPDLMSHDQELAVDRIPYEQLERRHPEAVFKKMKPSDVYDRLVLTKDMARFMPQANGSEIKVLDDHDDIYRFILSKRRGPSEKPTFRPAGWKLFMKNREAKPGDCIHIWPEVNEMKGTNYRINLFPSFIHFVSPEAEGLGDSNMAPPESQEETSDLRAWAIHGGLKL